jgi:hypothetical protein
VATGDEILELQLELLPLHVLAISIVLLLASILVQRDYQYSGTLVIENKYMHKSTTYMHAAKKSDVALTM